MGQVLGRVSANEKARATASELYDGVNKLGFAGDSTKPNGFKPVVCCTACPPGGLLLEAILLLVHVSLDVLQAYLIVLKDQYWYPAAICFLVGFAFLMYLKLLGQACLHGGGLGQTLRRGQMTLLVKAMFDVEKGFEAPGAGIVAPYAWTMVQDLSQLDAIVAICCLLFSARGLGEVCWQGHYFLAVLEWRNGAPSTHCKMEATEGMMAEMIMHSPSSVWTMKVFCTFISLG